MRIRKALIIASLIAAAGCRSTSTSIPLSRAEYDERIAAIQDEAERAREARDWDGMSAATDKAIALAIRLRSPASLSGAGWYASAEIHILLNERQFARAAARGNKNFDYIVQCPDAPSGLASSIHDMGDGSSELLALATRLKRYASQATRTH